MSQLSRGRAQRAQQSGAHLRVVERAHLALPEEIAESHARFVLEDALNTADFGDCGKLIVIRSLRLPRLPAHASGSEVARLIERAWRDMAPQALSFDDARAAHANVIYAPNAAVARIELLAHLVLGADVQTWFWPQLVSEFVIGRASGDNLLDVFVAALGDAIHLPALARALQKWPTAQWQALMSALPPSPPPGMREMLRLPAATGREPFANASLMMPAFAGDAVNALAPSQQSVVFKIAVQVALRLSPAMLRAVSIDPDPDWRLAAMIVANWIERCGAAPASKEIAAVFEALATHTLQAASAPSKSTASKAAPRNLRSHSLATRPNAVNTAAQIQDARQAQETAAPGSARPVARKQSSAPWLNDAAFTRAGGFLLLLNLLSLLHFDRWLGLQPSELRQLLLAALLDSFAARLKMPEDDPQRTLLALTADAGAALLDIECEWTGFEWPQRRAGKSPAGQHCAVRSLRLWQIAVRRTLRRGAGLSLIQLVMRDGFFASAAMHVDLIFALENVDLRLRRYGLDGDPGWLPWFGRIVSLHFMPAADLPTEPTYAR